MRVVSPEWLKGDTVECARALLGMTIVREFRGRRLEAIITETEAYDGLEDKASHAHRGRTPRNTVMFGPPGRWYVYLCYGLHRMLNVVTGPEGFPAAVLIRGVGDIHGPGRVTRFLRVSQACSGRTATPHSGLWIEDRGAHVSNESIVARPRIGVDHAKEWRDVPYRFILKHL